MVYATMTKDQNGLVNGCLLEWLMWLVSVAYGNWLAYKQRNNAKPLDRSGKIVQAEVLEAYPYWSSRTEADYLVNYHLHVYLNPSNTTCRTNSKEYVYFLADKLKTIDVKALLDHPEIQKAVGGESPMFFVFFVATINLVLLFGLAIFILGA